MALSKKATGRGKPPPIRIPTTTPPPRSWAGRCTPRSETRRTPTPTPPRSPTPASRSPESYNLDRLFMPSPTSSLPRRPPTPRSSSGQPFGVLSGYKPNPRDGKKPTVSVYTDVATLNLVRGNDLLLADVDTPARVTVTRPPSSRESGGKPRSPKSPTYSSGRADPEAKLLRRDKNYRRLLFCGGYLEDL